MYLHKYRPIRRTSNWAFDTTTRGVELMNMVSLLGMVAAFGSAKIRVVSLPMDFNADTLNLNWLCIAIAMLAVAQFFSMFIDGQSPYRRVSVLILSISSVLWAWLAMLTYHSADWVSSIGVHKQLFYMHSIMCGICWLAADYLHSKLND